MRADFGLGGRREDRFGELLAHLETFGKLDAADAAGGAVVLPAAADQVASGDALDQDGLEAHGDAGAALDHRHFLRLDDGFGINAGEVVREDAFELLEPEVGERGEHLALARNRVAQNDVECGNAVARDDEQLVIADGERIAHLAGVELLQGGNVDLGKTSHVEISL